MLRRIPAAGCLLAVAACKLAQASPSNNAPSNPFSDPTSPLAAFFGESSSSGFGSLLPAGGPLSSPTNGQISFRTKTRNGVRGRLTAVLKSCFRTAALSGLGFAVVAVAKRVFGSSLGLSHAAAVNPRRCPTGSTNTDHHCHPASKKRAKPSRFCKGCITSI